MFSFVQGKLIINEYIQLRFRKLFNAKLLLVNLDVTRSEISDDMNSGGFKVGGARGKTKKGAPLMTSSYSVTRDKHF